MQNEVAGTGSPGAFQFGMKLPRLPSRDKTMVIRNVSECLIKRSRASPPRSSNSKCKDLKRKPSCRIFAYEELATDPRKQMCTRVACQGSVAWQVLYLMRGKSCTWVTYTLCHPSCGNPMNPRISGMPDLCSRGREYPPAPETGR